MNENVDELLLLLVAMGKLTFLPRAWWSILTLSLLELSMKQS